MQNDTITHDIGLGATNVSAARSGSVFSGSTSITVTNLRGGYTLDSSALPAGSTVTGYTGTKTETVTISIPASAATANKTYTLTVTGKDDRCRANIAAIGHNSSTSYQRVVTVRIGTSWYTEVVTKTFTVTTGAYETLKPDLIITSLTPGKATYLTGENMTFSATVKNQGAAAAGRFDVGLTMGDLTHYAYIDSLAVGASQTVSFSFTAPSTAQTVTLNGKADSLGGIDELFAKVRKGAVRVLIGSTAKMGAGTNVQAKLKALHHLDCPWRPSDLQQRDGRILRQGNGNREVEVIRYITQDTFDAYSYQLVENKQKFISQIFTSKSPGPRRGGPGRDGALLRGGQGAGGGQSGHP